MALRVAVRRMPEAQQRVGGCFLSLMPQMKTLYLAYCANHPSAVSVLTEHRCVSWASYRGGGVGSRVCGSLWAARFCQLLLEMRCKHPCVYSRLVSFIILQVSAWEGLMSGFKILISTYNRNGRVLKSPLQAGPFGRRSGGLEGLRRVAAGWSGLPEPHPPSAWAWGAWDWGASDSTGLAAGGDDRLGGAEPEAVHVRSAAGRPGRQQQAALCVSDQARLAFLGTWEHRGA